MAAFYDLNVPYNSNRPTMVAIIRKLIELGYSKVAINYTKEFTVENGSKNKRKRKEKGRQSQSDPDSFDPEEFLINPILQELGETPRGFELYSRLTVRVGDADHIRFLRSPFADKFDILAVAPETDKIFHQACVELDLDIVCLDSEAKIPYRFKHTSTRSAVDRNVVFEVTYSPCIRSDYVRKQVMANALKIIRMTKGKNIVLSSGAQHYMEVRGPYDIMNLSLLFGVREDLSKCCVSRNCQLVTYHSFARTKSAKSVFTMRKLSESEMATEPDATLPGNRETPTILINTDEESLQTKIHSTSNLECVDKECVEGQREAKRLKIDS